MDFSSVILRQPTAEDGASVHQLITRTPELDSNSCYCNLLQCSHFSETSIIAKRDEETLGFISGYIKPQSPETLFVWQVAVSAKARGNGLGVKMLQNLLEREENVSVTHIETTITESNDASWALFNSLAGRFGAPIKHSIMFDRATHFHGEHDSELLARIGPLSR
ncbi:diaminobutyrate acetyltransferase [Neptunomonas japonica]|uniref:diaminobutyrate acetyltransferase n=1 Tax=Neptunomonas japonica TaxID=417574 RepID=UPI000415F76B|nr:diaminobutyrate acetyltransferase [Neptunomonas japonica]